MSGPERRKTFADLLEEHERAGGGPAEQDGPGLPGGARAAWDPGKRKTFAALFDEQARAAKAGAAAVSSGVRAPAGPATPAARGAGAAPGAAGPAAAQANERPLADRIALRDAFAGVRPLGERGPRRVAPPPPGEDRPLARGQMPDMRDPDAEARERLARLVAGGVTIDVVYEAGGYVQGLRRGADEGLLDALARGRERPDDVLDLHGRRGDEAEAEVARFVRRAHRRGARLLRLVHGKGLHSEGGAPVLRDRAVDALTRGGAAPLVLAFATAPEAQGGTGALLVRLVERL